MNRAPWSWILAALALPRALVAQTTVGNTFNASNALTILW